MPVPLDADVHRLDQPPRGNWNKVAGGEGAPPGASRDKENSGRHWVCCSCYRSDFVGRFKGYFCNAGLSWL